MVKTRKRVTKKQTVKKSVISSEIFDVYKYLNRINGVKVGRKFTREEMNAK